MKGTSVIGVGVIGAGHFGAVHARAISELAQFRVTAACAGNLDSAQRFVSEFGGIAYPSWRNLLEDKAVQVVVIATPHDHHEEIAVSAAIAGKHILLEKPMAPSRSACETIAQAVQAAGVHLVVGDTMHFALPCIRSKEVLDSGILGRPRIGLSWIIKPWMEANRKPWHLQRDSGGGMLMTAGIHALDRMVWLMGQNVVGVSAQTGALFHEQDADDTALLTLRFAGGGAGQVHSIGTRDRSMLSATMLICGDGILQMDFERGASICRNGVWEPVPNSIEPDWMFQAIVREWNMMSNAIHGEARTFPMADHSAHVVSILEAAFRASEERREIAI